MKIQQMKRFLTHVLLLAGAAIFLSSCEKVVGEGPVVTQERDYSDFNSVAISVSGTVRHTAGNEYRVIIHAQQNILDIIQTRVDNGELLIKFKDRKRVREHEDIEIELVSPELVRVDLSGSADVQLAGALAEDNFDANLSGSGNLLIEQANIAGQLKATISGSGNISIESGQALSSRFKVSGSGNILAEAMSAVNSVAEVSGSGNIRLMATGSLDASISGSGSVWYKGTPQVTQHVSGSGSVRPL